MDSQPVTVQVRESVRLDRFLTHRMAHVSRNRIQRHIERGDVLVDGRRVRPSFRLQGGEVLTLKPLEERRLDTASESMDLNVVYEDEHLVVVDKPAGVLVHPVGREFRRTLLNGLFHRMRENGEDAEQLGVVHRLDRLTSGLIVMAKRLDARRALAKAVEARRIQRVYLALVAGRPPRMQGSIDKAIRRDPLRPTRMQALDEAGLQRTRQRGVRSHVSSSGYSDPRLDLRPRPARTHYKVLRRFANATLMRFELETGRTHQIRVHAQAEAMPLLGDPLYGQISADGGRDTAPVELIVGGLERPALHAAFLSFEHPQTRQKLRFRAPLPADLRAIIAALHAPGP